MPIGRSTKDRKKMAVNKNKKVTEEVVAQTGAPSTETNNANDMTAQFMEMLDP